MDNYPGRPVEENEKTYHRQSDASQLSNSSLSPLYAAFSTSICQSPLSAPPLWLYGASPESTPRHAKSLDEAGRRQLLVYQDSPRNAGSASLPGSSEDMRTPFITAPATSKARANCTGAEDQSAAARRKNKHSHAPPFQSSNPRGEHQTPHRPPLLEEPLAFSPMGVITAPESKIGQSKTNIFVRNLPINMNEYQLRELFAPYGKIVACAIMRNIHTGESLGKAFVRYDTHAEAMDAMTEFMVRERLVGGALLSMQWAKKQHDNTPIGDARKQVRKLFVRNIPHDVTPAMLQQLFQRYGAVKNISVHADTAPANSMEEGDRCIAFVSFEEDGIAETAFNEVHNTFPFPSCEGVPVMIKLAEELPTRISHASASGAAGGGSTSNDASHSLNSNASKPRVGGGNASTHSPGKFGGSNQQSLVGSPDLRFTQVMTSPDGSPNYFQLLPTIAATVDALGRGTGGPSPVAYRFSTGSGGGGGGTVATGLTFLTPSSAGLGNSQGSGVGSGGASLVSFSPVTFVNSNPILTTGGGRIDGQPQQQQQQQQQQMIPPIVELTSAENYNQYGSGSGYYAQPQQGTQTPSDIHSASSMLSPQLSALSPINSFLPPQRQQQQQQQRYQYQQQQQQQAYHNHPPVGLSTAPPPPPPLPQSLQDLGQMQWCVVNPMPPYGGAALPPSFNNGLFATGAAPPLAGPPPGPLAYHPQRDIPLPPPMPPQQPQQLLMQQAQIGVMFSTAPPPPRPPQPQPQPYQYQQPQRQQLSSPRSEPNALSREKPATALQDPAPTTPVPPQLQQPIVALPSAITAATFPMVRSSGEGSQAFSALLGKLQRSQLQRPHPSPKHSSSDAHTYFPEGSATAKSPRDGDTNTVEPNYSFYSSMAAADPAAGTEAENDKKNIRACVTSDKDSVVQEATAVSPSANTVNEDGDNIATTTTPQWTVTIESNNEFATALDLSKTSHSSPGATLSEDHTGHILAQHSTVHSPLNDSHCEQEPAITEGSDGASYMDETTVYMLLSAVTNAASGAFEEDNDDEIE